MSGLSAQAQHLFVQDCWIFGIPIKTYLFLLIYGCNFPVEWKKKRHFSEVKMLVSIMLPTTHKGCFLGAGDKSWVEIAELKSCVSLSNLYGSCLVFLGAQTREIVPVAEEVILVNSHSWAFWLCLFPLDVILNTREGTRQATDAGF